MDAGSAVLFKEGFVCVLNTVEITHGGRREVVGLGDEADVWATRNNILVVYDEEKKPWIKLTANGMLDTMLIHSVGLMMSDRRSSEQVAIPHSDHPEAHDSFARLFLPNIPEQNAINRGLELAV